MPEKVLRLKKTISGLCLNHSLGETEKQKSKEPTFSIVEPHHCTVHGEMLRGNKQCKIQRSFDIEHYVMIKNGSREGHLLGGLGSY